MPSQFVWKSFGRFTYWSECLWLTPLTFSGERREFKRISFCGSNLLIWYICSSLVLFTGGFMGVLLFTKLFKSTKGNYYDLSILELVFCALYALTSLLILVLVHMSLVFGSQLAEALNQLITLDKALKRWGFDITTEIDSVGIFMHIYLMISNLIPVLLSIFGVYENIDVLFLFLTKFVNVNIQPRSIPLTCIRFLCSLITVTEIWKQIGFFSLSSLLALQIVTKVLQVKALAPRKLQYKPIIIGRGKHKWRKLYFHWCFYQAFTIYRRLQIIIYAGLNPTLVFFFPYVMALGLLLCILCDCTTITLHSKIESALLIVMPAISFGVKFIILTVLPTACAVNDKALHFISEWRQVTQVLKSQISRKKLRSLPPLRFYVGSLFHCKRSTKTTYFSVIMYYTITAVISFK